MTTKPVKKKTSARHLARLLAVQGLYANLLNPEKDLTVIFAFLADNNECYLQAQQSLLKHLLAETIVQFDALLFCYKPFIDYELVDLNLIEQTILVVAAFELKDSLNVPAVVIINEAVELTKSYGAPHTFINGLVDKLAKQLRPQEFDAKYS